jgi:coenzyme F420 hydrogenase subunit beta
VRLRVINVKDVAEQSLCCGCGACAYMAPDAIRMVDVASDGRRPLVDLARLNGQGEAALQVCPGNGLEHTFDRGDPELIKELAGAWGPVYDVFEGYAADPDVRHGGSSGGAATALALYSLERGGAHGVLHTTSREDAPHLNRTVISRSRDELLGATGSRYAPASPCEGLGLVEAADGPCVFIGKPCDVAAVHKARRLRPELDRKISLTIGFFCAGTPSTKGTVDLLRKVGVEDPATVTSLRYRGNGWPGRWVVRWRTPEGEREASLSYEESWDFLQKYRQWRCHICPDHTGEFADVAVGDPWYRAIEAGEAGRSLIVARTKRGREVVRAAAAAGYLVLEKSDPSLLPQSQPNLLRTRGRLWGQMVALAVAGAPRPRFVGMATAMIWWSVLPLNAKLQSTFGTVRRVRDRRLKARRRIVEAAPVQVGAEAGAPCL